MQFHQLEVNSKPYMCLPSGFMFEIVDNLESSDSHESIYYPKVAISKTKMPMKRKFFST